MAQAKKGTKTATTKKDDKYIKELEEHLKKMEEVINKFSTMNIGSDQPTVNNITQYIGENNKDVTVTSLTVGELNLSTEGYGEGTIYTFENIGEEQIIPMEDLKKIIKNNKSFIEGGNIFINDEEVVESQKLGNIYKKLLSYEEMLGLFNKDREAFEKVFVSMANNQKETLKRIIFKKLEDDEKKVDMNIVRVIDENMGTNIMEEFSNQKKLSELIKE